MTDRLKLRTWDLADFEALATMLADPEVARFVNPDGKPLSRFAAWQSLSSTIGHWHLRGFGMFAVEERSSGQLVGRVGPWQPEGWPAFEVGWTLRRESWGCGYAAEAASACLRYAFTELQCPHVASFIVPDNIRSIRVAERIGERPECESRLPTPPIDRVVLQYGISREDWARAS